MRTRIQLVALTMSLLLLLVIVTPLAAQGGPGTKDFPIRDFGACINLPDFTIVTEPDDFNTLYTVPGLFEINFAEYLMPIATLPTNNGEIYNAMITLLNTVNASDYGAIEFNHPQYVSAAVEFTLDGRRMFGMIYRNQNDKLFFLFADKVEGFDMLAIGRAIFAADRNCTPLPGYATAAGNLLPQEGYWTITASIEGTINCNNGYSSAVQEESIEPGTFYVDVPDSNGQTFILQEDVVDTFRPTLQWNAAAGYYSADATSFMIGDNSIPDVDAHGVEIRLIVHSPTSMTGNIVVWWTQGELHCEFPPTLTATRN